MKSLLLYANEDSGFDSRLQTALDITRALDAHLSCVQVTPFEAFVVGDPFGGLYAMSNVLEAVREAEEAHRTRVEARLRAEGVCWDWQHHNGAPPRAIAARSSLFDLVILSLPKQGEHDELSLVGEVAVHIRAPVLAVPASAKSFDCFGPAMVAWNGSAEAAHALRFTLPMLAKASQVYVVTAIEEKIGFPPTDASEYLSRHGINSTLREWPRATECIVESLEAASQALGVSYVVMGAYGHSRLRETVLGGTTYGMLRRGNLPLLLAH